MSFFSQSPSSFVSEDQAAELLNIRPTTLRRWRWAKQGPKYHKFGRLVRYSTVDLQAFIESGMEDFKEVQS